MNMIILDSETSGAGIGAMMQALQTTMARYGMIIVAILGLAMIIVGVYQVAKNLISHGKGQTSWVTTILLLFVGGVLAMVGGWQTIGGLLKVGNETLSEMANGQYDTTGQVIDPFNDESVQPK